MKMATLIKKFGTVTISDSGIAIDGFSVVCNNGATAAINEILLTVCGKISESFLDGFDNTNIRVNNCSFVGAE